MYMNAYMAILKKSEAARKDYKNKAGIIWPSDNTNRMLRS